VQQQMLSATPHQLHKATDEQIATTAVSGQIFDQD
jgi:hypothetical protein